MALQNIDAVRRNNARRNPDKLLGASPFSLCQEDQMIAGSLRNSWFRRRTVSLCVAVLVLSLTLIICWALAPSHAVAGGAREIPNPSKDEAAKSEPALEIAVIAGGCFWGVQGVYQHVDGVVSAVSGYAGGEKATANYGATTRGNTGHAEAVKITYDPRRISYGRILKVFFSVAHDPTQLNRQGPDVGTQYRSTIFPTNAEQVEHRRPVRQAALGRHRDPRRRHAARLPRRHRQPRRRSPPRIARPIRCCCCAATSAPALTLNFIRALADGGFADLHHPEYWDLAFVDGTRHAARVPAHRRRDPRVAALHGASPASTPTMLRRVDFFTSHEGLALHYEQAQTRTVPRRAGWYNLSTHFPWIGMRTAQLDGAHVEFFRGIENPLGIKVGPAMTAEWLRRAARRPRSRATSPGRITLIHRMGAGKVATRCRRWSRRCARAGRTRALGVRSDARQHRDHAGRASRRAASTTSSPSSSRPSRSTPRSAATLGGVHFELTGEDVTECIGGARGLAEADLERALQDAASIRASTTSRPSSSRCASRATCGGRREDPRAWLRHWRDHHPADRAGRRVRGVRDQRSSANGRGAGAVAGLPRSFVLFLWFGFRRLKLHAQASRLAGVGEPDGLLALVAGELARR